MKVVSDRKRLVEVNGQPDHYEPVVTDHRDYYAFGQWFRQYIDTGGPSGEQPLG